MKFIVNNLVKSYTVVKVIEYITGLIKNKGSPILRFASLRVASQRVANLLLFE